MVEDILAKVRGLGKKVEFVKYQFTDMQGNIKEVTLSRDSIKDKGMTTVDGSSVFGKIIPPTESDMLLVPDPATLVQIPWSSDTARVLCNVFQPAENESDEPTPFPGCPRSILATAERSLENRLGKRVKDIFKRKKIKKFHAHFAPELEFILLPKGYNVDAIHLDQMLRNENYFVPPSREADEALKGMVRSLSKMGMKKEKYHGEVTTYQYEIGIGHGNILAIADATVTLKYIVEQIAQIHGLRAYFIPKFREGVNGSGMHVHQNLAVTVGEEEQNLFFDKSRPDCLSDIGKGYIAGLLKHAKEITAVASPLPVSYKRLVPGCEAPTYIAWDWKNRTALCRGHSKGTQKIRVEYRAPDPKCNPYLAFAAMLYAGLEGIDTNLQLPEADKRNFYEDNDGIDEVPGNLGEALEEMNRSAMLRRSMGSFIIDSLYTLGKDLWKVYLKKVSSVDVSMFL